MVRASSTISAPHACGPVIDDLTPFPLRPVIVLIIPSGPNEGLLLFDANSRVRRLDAIMGSPEADWATLAGASPSARSVAQKHLHPHSGELGEADTAEGRDDVVADIKLVAIPCARLHNERVLRLWALHQEGGKRLASVR